MKTLKQEWQEYAAGVYPEGLEGGREAEIRRAFVSGAAVASARMAESAELPLADEEVAFLEDVMATAEQELKSAIQEAGVKLNQQNGENHL